MSEQILRAILRIFAVVARQDEVTHQEREQISLFLKEHLNETSVAHYEQIFESYIPTAGQHDFKHDVESLRSICREIVNQITSKQKIVVVLELIRIVYADASITSREEDLLRVVVDELKVDEEDVDAIKQFVMSHDRASFDHPSLLLVDVEPQGAYHHARHIRRSHLNGTLIVLYVRQADIYFIRVLCKRDIYLNGMPIKLGSISVLAVGSTLRWEGDPTVYFGDILNLFKQLKGKSRITFDAQRINYTFPNGRIGLRDINLFEESGSLVALMGASGAGKSTLLNVLNGSDKLTSGQVLVNGIDIAQDPKRIEGVIGFVPQDDLLIEELTVYQNLYYAAKLCFDDRTDESIDLLVLRVLDDLGLMEIRDLKVGTPLQKTISGGQRKRLNIGLELLREPAILFCDEPTSGLSSRDSENIIDLLKTLSLKGKLVFSVIHQPSSDIFKKFDKLLILDTGGYQIYYGNPVDAIVYFKKCINLIDSDQGECYNCGNVNPEQIFNIIETKTINEYGHFTNERRISPVQWHTLYVQGRQPAVAEPSADVPHSTLRLPGKWKQAILFARRDIQAKIHNRQYMIINLLEAPLLAFILAFIVRYYNEDVGGAAYSFRENLNMPAYFFMSVIVALFMGLTVSAEEIIRDRKILKRETFLNLSRRSYLESKIFILFFLSALQTLTFVYVGNSLLGIRHMLPEHWWILFSTSCFANMLGLNISSAFNSAVTIYILIPLLLIPQLILSGVVVKFDKLNPTIGNSATVPIVGDLMASRWVFEAAMVTQFKDNSFERVFYPYDKRMAQSDYKKIYYVPELETRLQAVLRNSRNTDSVVQERLEKDLALLQSEIRREMAKVGKEEEPWVNGLQPGKFDSTIYTQTNDFLSALKTYYTRRYNVASEEKEKLVTQLTHTEQGEEDFERFRDSHHNDAIAEQVRNAMEQHRIIEKDGRLVQKINPIYKDPEPDNTIDFDAQFYMPAKHFLGLNIDTFWFNTMVIWLMTAILAFTLYYDVLRKIVSGRRPG